MKGNNIKISVNIVFVVDDPYVLATIKHQHQVTFIIVLLSNKCKMCLLPVLIGSYTKTGESTEP